MFSNLLKLTRHRMAQRARYHRLLREIEGLTARDLADFNADRASMISHAYREVYG